MRGDRALARASNLLGYKEYINTIQIAIKLPTTVLNTRLTDYLFQYETNERVGRDNIFNTASTDVPRGRKGKSDTNPSSKTTVRKCF